MFDELPFSEKVQFVRGVKKRERLPFFTLDSLTRSISKNKKCDTPLQQSEIIYVIEDLY